MKAKIVFITGASSGIGEGCARKFASQGWNSILKLNRQEGELLIKTEYRI